MHSAMSGSSFAIPQNLALEEYITFLETSLRANPSSADLHTMLGMAYIKLGDVCRALHVLRVAIALDANHFFAHLRYADLLHRLKSLKDALSISKRALSLARGAVQWRMANEQLIRIQEDRESFRWSLSCDEPIWTVMLAVLALLAAAAPHLNSALR